MTTDITDYLDIFAARAVSEGLPARRPGANWFALPPFTRGSHISLSVRRAQIQVNLNNDDDSDRRKFDLLWRDRDVIQAELGVHLDWEAKEGRKKTAIRTTLEEGYEAPRSSWDRQHQWALTAMKHFIITFGDRLV